MKCLFCGRTVQESSAESGSESPDWAVDGDFGCDASPATSADGVGNHATTEEEARAEANYAIKNPPVLTAGPFSMVTEHENDPWQWV